MDLVRDVLDKPLVDRDGKLMGRIDGIVIKWTPGEQPRVDRLECGFVVLARRIGPRTERFVRAVRERWSICKEERFAIPFERVMELDPHAIKVDEIAEQTPNYEWELWLRKHVIGKIPGFRHE